MCLCASCCCSGGVVCIITGLFLGLGSFIGGVGQLRQHQLPALLLLLLKVAEFHIPNLARIP